MFEQTVMQKIGHLLKEGETAEFHNGTLFLNSGRPTANDVYIELCNIYRKRFINFNIVTEGEYAFDFTA